MTGPLDRSPSFEPLEGRLLLAGGLQPAAGAAALGSLRPAELVKAFPSAVAVDFSHGTARLSGALGGLGEQDLFRLNARRTDVIEVAAVRMRLGTLLSVYDADGALLATNDVAGSGGNLLFKTAAGRTYYIGVAGRKSAVGRYQFDVSRSRDDYGDTAKTSRALALTADALQVPGRIDFAGDHDYLRFKAATDGVLSVEQTPAGSLVVITELTGVQPQQVGAAVGNAPAEAATLTVEAGKVYYIEVVSSGPAVGGYELSLTRTDPAPPPPPLVPDGPSYPSYIDQRVTLSIFAPVRWMHDYWLPNIELYGLPTQFGKMQFIVYVVSSISSNAPPEMALLRETVVAARALGVKVIPGLLTLPSSGRAYNYDSWFDSNVWAQAGSTIDQLADLRDPDDPRIAMDNEFYIEPYPLYPANGSAEETQAEQAMRPMLDVLNARGVRPWVLPGADYAPTRILMRQFADAQVVDEYTYYGTLDNFLVRNAALLAAGRMVMPAFYASKLYDTTFTSTLAEQGVSEAVIFCFPDSPHPFDPYNVNGFGVGNSSNAAPPAAPPYRNVPDTL